MLSVHIARAVICRQIRHCRPRRRERPSCYYRFAAGDCFTPGRMRRTDPLLDVDFQHAEGRFVTLDRHVQGGQQPLGGVVVQDDPFGNLDRLAGQRLRLGIQTEVDDQFLRRAGDAAEIRIEPRGR